MNAVDGGGWGGWALDKHTASEVAAWLARHQPAVVVEAGSGRSTLLLAEYASRTGAAVTSLEHDEHHAAVTRAALAERDLTGWVDLRVAPLADMDTPAGPQPWYDTALPPRVDFALVDGPPGAVGRAAALFALMPVLNGDGWEVWLDDADRAAERAHLTLWGEHFPLRVQTVATPKGLARILPADRPDPPHIDAHDVAVTLLTGGRPDLLARTVAALRAGAPGLLDTAHVAVLHNGPDPGTTALLDTYGWIDVVTVLPERLPVAQASLALLGFPPPRKYTLHLEDDWQLCTVDERWLDRARTILEESNIGQVRLRHRGDPVLKKHMVTGRPLLWEPGPEGSLTAQAHYTLNPSLMRSEDVADVWPAADERAAARTFHGRMWRVAQLLPGVFRHIGEGASLRKGER